MKMTMTLLLVPAILICLAVPNLHAEMSSTNYRITTSVFSGGGGMMSSPNYQLLGTVAQPTPPGNSSSTNFILDAGFWYTMLTDAVGDVNNDGTVDLKDVIAALQVVTGLSPAEIIKEADADGDGKIGLSEALHILRRLGE